MRVAAIDCGTNTIRLLIADVEGSQLAYVDKATTIVRLGEGVDRTRAFAPQALERTFTACREYRARIRAAGVGRVRFVATSASRDVTNRDAFATGVREIFGVDPEVVSGDEEAKLAFLGATRWIGGTRPAPYLVVDLGGGSTEVVLGGTGPAATSVVAATSMDVGSVRLTERHLHTDPPTEAEIAAAVADVDTALDAAARVVPLERAATVVGVAGTHTSLAAHALGLHEYDRTRIDRAEVASPLLKRTCADMLSRSVAQRLALGFLQPGRADVIGGGAVIVRALFARLAALGAPAPGLVVSESDILDGIALGLAGP